MARGNSRAQSEARSPEVVALRDRMYEPDGVSLSEAIEKDPTLNAVIGNKELLDAWKKSFDKSLDEAASSHDFESGSSTSIDPDQSIFVIGKKAYIITYPEVELELQVQDDSFDHEWGGRLQTERYDPYATIEESSHDFKKFIEDSTIEELSPDDFKRLIPSTYKQGGGEVPETKGVNQMMFYYATKEFRAAAKNLPDEIRYRINQKQYKDETEKFLATGPKLVPARESITIPGKNGMEPAYKLDYPGIRGPSAEKVYTKAAAEEKMAEMNKAIDVMKKIRAPYED